MSLLVSFTANGAISSTAGKAIAKLIAHFTKVSTVNISEAPRATNVFIAVTIAVIGNTKRKLCTYGLYRLSSICFNISRSGRLHSHYVDLICNNPCLQHVSRTSLSIENDRAKLSRFLRRQVQLQGLNVQLLYVEVEILYWNDFGRLIIPLWMVTY